MALPPWTRSPMCASHRSTAISAKPRISRTSSARSAVPAIMATERPAATRDERYMRIALGLAARGLGNAWPNPAVGCIIVQNDRIVGPGGTQTGGRPHAETGALRQAGDAARGATAYVTLEPCSHHGQTPPCADALVNAGIARCVVAVEDPD